MILKLISDIDDSMLSVSLRLALITTFHTSDRVQCSKPVYCLTVFRAIKWFYLFEGLFLPIKMFGCLHTHYPYQHFLPIPTPTNNILKITSFSQEASFNFPITYKFSYSLIFVYRYWFFVWDSTSSYSRLLIWPLRDFTRLINLLIY